MRKKTALILLAVTVAAAAMIFWVLFADRPAENADSEPETNGGEEIIEFDGPGSYIEEIRGTVTEVTDSDEYSYIITVRLDEAYAESFGEEYIRLLIDENPDTERFVLGDTIKACFPGGTDWEGDPPMITSVNYCSLEEDDS